MTVPPHPIDAVNVDEIGPHWIMRRYGSSDLFGWNIYAVDPGDVHRVSAARLD